MALITPHLAERSTGRNILSRIVLPKIFLNLGAGEKPLRTSRKNGQ